MGLILVARRHIYLFYESVAYSKAAFFVDYELRKSLRTDQTQILLSTRDVQLLHDEFINHRVKHRDSHDLKEHVLSLTKKIEQTF